MLFTARNGSNGHVECTEPWEREALLKSRIALAPQTELALNVRSPGKDLRVPLTIKVYLIVIFLLPPAIEACARYLLCIPLSNF